MSETRGPVWADPKYLIVFLITLVLVAGEARYSILGGYERLATTLGICIATEVLLSWWLRGRVANLASAYITGISLALLIKPQANILWPFALGAFLAHVTLTYVVCFALLALLRHAMVGGPLLAELAPITGPMYQLFVFFMVTDPRTTVSTRRGRMVVVAIVALVETVIRLAGDFQVGLLRPLYPSPPILALAIVGPIAMWWDLYRQARRPTAASPGS